MPIICLPAHCLKQARQQQQRIQRDTGREAEARGVDKAIQHGYTKGKSMQRDDPGAPDTAQKLS